MDNITMLTGFSLTRQEAQIYLELLKSEQMTGYEVSKRTGISRSNVYTALAGLVEKGASDMMEGEPTYYTAVPMKSFCDAKLRLLSSYKEELIKSSERPSAKFEGFAAVKGCEAVTDRIIGMINEAESRVYISCAWSMMQDLREALLVAAGRGLKVVIITTPPFELYRAQVYHTNQPSNQIRVIIDNTYAVTGEYTPNPDECSCLYSGSAYLKDLVKDALKNEIRTISAGGR